MNEFEKVLAEKVTENGDVAYNSTGDNLIDLLFMADFFTKNLDQVHIGNSDKEKLFAMYMRDPRFGQGRRDLGRRLMKLSGVDVDNVILAGRFDDLYHIASKECIDRLHEELLKGNELAKKWMPRLTGKDKKIAKAFCKVWDITPKEYRQLIKTDKTVEYKLSYAEPILEDKKHTVLDELFNETERLRGYSHPLVDTINFEQVPSLAMLKYLKAFSTREDLAGRYAEYIEAVKQDKAKINTATANVHDAHKVVKNTDGTTDFTEQVADVIGKKVVEQETSGLSLNCICVLDTSASMYWDRKVGESAESVAHAIATHSTFAPNQLISFSSRPQLMTIKGRTLKEQYRSMYTGDCSNTDFGAVMKILAGLKKFPDYLIVLSDMEFDQGSSKSKAETMKIFKEYGAQTKIIWWNFNNRNRTSPEYDEYGNIYMSGFDLQALLQIPGIIDMKDYIDKILAEYAKKIGLN